MRPESVAWVAGRVIIHHVSDNRHAECRNFIARRWSPVMPAVPDRPDPDEHGTAAAVANALSHATEARICAEHARAESAQLREDARRLRGRLTGGVTGPGQTSARFRLPV